MDATTVIIGAGHAGLAMSRRLTERSIDNVVLERGEVANSWRTERWDSLRLLTPNWQCDLPGRAYDGPDPHGYMSMPEVVDFITGYASETAAPVRTNTTVLAVRPVDDGFDVVTDSGTWRCATVVVASGPSNVAAVPALAAGVPSTVAMVTPMTYRSPADLDERGVLVVGASATGVQLADEIRRSGREVTIAVGEHVRLPRTYRGRDTFWWMDAAGVLDERHDEVDDLVRARHVPSPQLIGSPERRTVDLTTLDRSGVRIVGRLSAIAGSVAQFSGGLANVCRLADLKLERLLGRFDEWAAQTGADEVGPPERFEPTRPPHDPTLGLDLGRGEVGTIVWATGYRPDHSWLGLPAFDHKGRIRHDGGVIRDSPGAYLLGANLLRRRRSSFISGASSDTADIAEHLHRHLDGRRRSTIPLAAHAD
ncbi:MAG: NAD(P)-binding domain-containing protein [Ilumatobacteraceae bacterium]